MQAAARTQQAQPATIYRILFAISLGHFLNDCMQSVIPALFPVFEKSMNLNYTQIGWIAFALNMTSSIMQPVFGVFADKRPRRFIANCNVFKHDWYGWTRFSAKFYFVIISVLFVGFGSAIFHPEGSRVAYMAAGGKRGLAQSIYQVGGNTGQSMAPLFTAFIFIGLGQFGTIWFTLIAGIGVVVLYSVSKWYKSELATRQRLKKKQSDASFTMNKQIIFAIGLLIFLVFARSWYGAGILNFFQFYIIEKFNLPIKSAQLYVFIYDCRGVWNILWRSACRSFRKTKYFIVFYVRVSTVYFITPSRFSRSRSASFNTNRLYSPVKFQRHGRLCSRADAGENWLGFRLNCRACFWDGSFRSCCIR